MSELCVNYPHHEFENGEGAFCPARLFALSYFQWELAGSREEAVDAHTLDVKRADKQTSSEITPRARESSGRNKQIYY